MSNEKCIHFYRDVRKCLYTYGTDKKGFMVCSLICKSNQNIDQACITTLEGKSLHRSQSVKKIKDKAVSEQL